MGRHSFHVADDADAAGTTSAPTAPTIVAIDGPAGSGKSSVSKATARTLGFDYLDTGAAYRALAWLMLDKNVDTEDAAAVIAALDDFDYSIGTDPDAYFVRVGDTDVTEAIREPRVSASVSAIARVPEVRAHLTEIFRRLARDTQKPGIVIEGRDITTVVVPEAPVRILLTASEEARMARRSAEISTQSAKTVAEQLRSRDRADSQVVDFMSAADGVTTVDSTHLDFEQTVDAVIDVITTYREELA
ncbi:(d)CMP kinase [Leifsonia sp. A12D58]|uniref:(d)CMP kinase n=1 Tax=Leifsonia sp. A12D58 TaxID=3397674 RepID=UPI0039DF8D08